MERKVYPLETHKLMGKLLDDHYAQAKRAKEEGRKIVWCVGQVDTNIVVAMDYLPVYPENHATLCGARGVSTEQCLVAEAHDFSPDLCSYARNELGTIFAQGGKSPVGGLPHPDLLLVATLCNTHLKWWEEMSRIFNVPLIVLDTPYIHDGLSSEDMSSILSYVRRQLEEHIVMLEEITGKTLNYDRFQEVIEITTEAGRLYGEVVNSARHIPAPLTSFDTFLHLAPLMVLRGFPEAVDYYKELKREVGERIRQGVSAVGEELYRLYWDNIPIWFRLGYLGRKFASYGACLVAAAYPFAWIEAFGNLDPSNPLDSIAKSQTLLFLNRGTGYRIDYLCQMLKDFSVDGMIMQMSRTCKPYIMDQYVIMKEAEKRTGIPAVLIEGDMVDSRLFSQTEVDSRIESFMEILSKRRG
jgi:bcr-type benzoyl-CoA reductase subunit B